MSDTHASNVPAGWYADPHNPQQLRWWSGEAWTEHVAPLAPPQPVQEQPPVQQPEPVQLPEPFPQSFEQTGAADPFPTAAATPTPSYTDPAAQQLPSRRAMRDNPGAVDEQPLTAAPWLQPLSEEPVATPSAPAVPDVSQWGLAPSGERRSRNAAKVAGPTGTLAAWIIALSPVIAAAALGYVLLTYGSDFGTGFPQIAIAAPYLLVLLFAALDRSQLVRAGYEMPAAWTWAALTAPVYLLVRGNAIAREEGSGRAPFIGWIVFFVLAIAGFVGYGFLTGHPLVAGLPG